MLAISPQREWQKCSMSRSVGALLSYPCPTPHQFLSSARDGTTKSTRNDNAVRLMLYKACIKFGFAAAHGPSVWKSDEQIGLLTFGWYNRQDVLNKTRGTFSSLAHRRLQQKEKGWLCRPLWRFLKGRWWGGENPSILSVDSPISAAKLLFLAARS